VVLAIATALGQYARLPIPPGAGKMFPRVAQPPNLSVLLALLGVGSVVWYALFLALPLLLWIAKRLNSEKHGRTRVIAASLSGIVALILVTSYIEFIIAYNGAPSRPTFVMFLPEAMRQNILPWIALAGIVFAVESRRRAVGLAVDRERLRSEIAEQRLVALTAQLQPHFLFNTLQGISTLIHRDPNAADEMLAKLADLLRDVLRDRDRVVVPLSDEVHYARTYLEIAKLRFGNRLDYSIDVPPETASVEVPLFILQPLLENALNHGIGSRLAGGTIRLSASRNDGFIRIQVSDDGEGITSANVDRGIGITNTRERLNASFGGTARFSLEPQNTGGTLATIEIPRGSTSRG
jgi:two-component system LytT family sensor kinase